MRVRPGILATLVCLAPASAGAQEADLILTNASIWTGDSLRPAAQALAIRGDRILAVGSAADMARHRTAFTRVLDAGGRWVGPGFIDNHTHFGQAGALLLGVNLLDVADETMLVRRVREARERLPRGAWMTGGDWGAYEAWARNSTGGRAADSAGFRPHRSMIDSVTPETPALLVKWDRSQYLANGAALRAAGTSCAWQGVECERDSPTGRLTSAAAARVRAAMPEKTMGQRLAEARTALAQLRSLGVTTVHDITPASQLEVYQELLARDELTTRIYARPTLDKWDELRAIGIRHGFGHPMLKIGGLKGFVDGIMGNSTARFYEGYMTSGLRGSWRDSTNTGATSGPGSGMEPAGNMLRNLIGADSSGMWVQTHAIGDEAIDTLLTMYEHVMRTNPERDRRYRVIHTQVIRSPEVAARMARLGIAAEMQPYHAIDDMRWMEERIGKRARWAYAFRTLHEAGVLLSFGSDWPGTNASWYTANPLHGMYAAVTRQTLEGHPAGGWYPEERIDAETALRAYTVNNAWVAGEEAEKGSLTAGKLADLVVLDADPLRVASERLKNVTVVMTMVGGRIVHGEGALR
jgi:predicted amidohydrolase YtcJ